MSTPASPDSCSALAPGQVRGLKPWFPWPLSRWRWLNEPVRAERLAALRLGVGLLTFLDVVLSFLPISADLAGQASIMSPELLAERFDNTQRWSLLSGVQQPGEVRLILCAWAGSAFLLALGLFSRLSAAATWAVGVSILNSNPLIDNAGDMVRSLATFYLLLSPCGTVWSVDAWWRRRYRWQLVRSEDGGLRGISLVRREVPLPGPFYVHPWPLCLLFVQMMVIYLFNGIAKAKGGTWHEGTSLYYVLSDLTLSRWSYAVLPLPLWLTSVLTWSVLWWELLFVPVMLVPWRRLADRVARMRRLGIHHLAGLLRWNREIFLLFGVSFHVGILVSMELGFFAPYMLCLYLPLLPWERLSAAGPAEVPREGEPPGEPHAEGSAGSSPSPAATPAGR